MATLYVVGTPIGNLDDITFRALKVLSEVDFVLCEDTRVTKKLLTHYKLIKNTISYHAHSDEEKTLHIIDLLKQGKNIALVSDAGTPAISDPGSMLIKIIRENMSAELKSGELKIVAIPGPSALVSALSIAGVNCSEFTFLGFMPHKKGRETIFKEIAESERTVVFYESPHRIMKTLESLVKYLEGVDKKVTLARELTKIFEEVVSGSAREVLEYFTRNAENVRGEFVVIIS